MSDDQQPEELRPIPDGGLKDTMPGWLKRPPAWRNMPTADQRHERTLPDPDTSEIDPKTLVDVSDLPQWLQTIAARGEVPAPQPDETVGFALQQIQAVSARQMEPDPSDPSPEENEVEAESPEVELTADDSVTPEKATEQAPMVQVSQPVAKTPPPAESRVLTLALIISIVVIIVALGIGAFSLL